LQIADCRLQIFWVKVGEQGKHLVIVFAHRWSSASLRHQGIEVLHHFKPWLEANTTAEICSVYVFFGRQQMSR